MARPKTANLTQAERRIMEVLWKRGEATVRDVTDALAKDHDLAYTTVLTTTRILTDKKYVGFRKEGRTHVFRPLISKDDARSNALTSLMKNLFDGSPKMLAQHLIESESLSEDDLSALRDLINAKDGEAE